MVCRTLVLGLLGALVALGVGAPAGAAPGLAPAKPNVVVILTDDEPALDGRLMDFMPNAHELFRKHGVTFTDFHVETSLCCPGRAGYLTGQHTHNHGVTRNVAKIFDPRMTLATALDTAGYDTALVGKYYNQYGRIAPVVPPGWDHWAAFGDARYYEYELWVDGDPAPEVYGRTAGDYSTDVLAAKAVEVIESAPARDPLFLWVAPNAPHAPTWEVAPRYAKARCNVPRWRPPNWDELDVKDKPAYVQRRKLIGGPGKKLLAVCRQLLAVDDLVGSVRDALDASGRLENTIFVYAGDNGYFEGEHRIASGKAAPYVTEVPFAVSWAAGLGTRSRAIDERLMNIDLAPTICELAGCTLGPFPNDQPRPDGLSFAGLLLGTETTVGRDALLEQMPEVATPLDSPYAAVVTTPLSPLGEWHYVEYENGDRELYDISHGPCWEWNRSLPGDPCRLTNRTRYP
jgi:arylsulfatase A-like enzyme